MRYAYQAQVVPATGEFVARIRHLRHIQHTKSIVKDSLNARESKLAGIFQSLRSIRYFTIDMTRAAKRIVDMLKAQMLIKRNGFL